MRSGLIKTPQLARKIIEATHRGIESSGASIPVSVKTRIGFNKEEIDFTYYGETIRTSPVGAKILIDLYQKGLLAMKLKTHVQEPSIEIVNYAASSESYKKDCAEKARQKYLVDHPNEITEEDFDYDILDKVIYKKCGAGNHSLLLI